MPFSLLTFPGQTGGAFDNPGPTQITCTQGMWSDQFIVFRASLSLEQDQGLLYCHITGSLVVTGRRLAAPFVRSLRLVCTWLAGS